MYNDDGTVEKQDKYLGRMSGLIRTYAALIQSPLPPGVRSHPHSTSEAWKWLARYVKTWFKAIVTLIQRRLVDLLLALHSHKSSAKQWLLVEPVYDVFSC